MTITREMRPQALSTYLPAFIDEGEPVFISGPPGIGKSDIVRQVATDMGRDIIDIRLLLMDSVDLRGMPHLSVDETGSETMKWAPPVFLPKDPESNAVIFLDELTAAPQSVMSAALQLVLDHRIGEYILPKNVRLIAAGNRSSDRTGARDLPSALANRFNHVTLKVNFDDFQTWGVQHFMHPEVLGYLSFAKSSLCQFDAKTSSGAYPTPRSWAKVSKMMRSGRLPESLIPDMVSGYVGEGVGLDFIAQRKAAGTLPDPNDIFAGKLTNWKANNIAAQFTLVCACNANLKNLQDNIGAHDGLTLDQWNACANNYVSFMNTKGNLNEEVTMMAVYQGIKTLKILYSARLPAYKDFYSVHHKTLKSLQNI